MGAWGSGLYANDTTCDVRDSYIDFLREGFDNQTAYEKTLEEYRDLIGDQDEPLFWYALADTQWRVGRLTPDVKAKALDWIENNGGLELWLESKSKRTGWIKTLSDLRLKLESSMPKEKKITKPKIVNSNLWNLDDVYAYRLHCEEAKQHGLDGKYILIQKIGEYEYDTILMRLSILDGVFDDLPNIDIIDDLRTLPLNQVIGPQIPVSMSCYMKIYKVKDYPVDHLIYLGNKKRRKIDTARADRLLGWDLVDEVFTENYLFWSDKEYEKVENAKVETYRWVP